MTDKAWLVLTLTPGLTAESITGRLQQSGSAEALAGEMPPPNAAQLDLGLAWLDGAEAHLVPVTDPRYPDLLRQIPRPPIALFVRGAPDVLALPQLAIVGSRSATPGGAETAQSFAAHLAARGFCITSGLAEGIDAAAHRGALAAGGKTIAVCGTGPENVYPRQHAGLAAEIVARGGAVVSEFAPGTPVLPANFPRRNRIISGLAVGTLVVEASQRSGALITARHAMEQGREVFAIPGSIHNPVARGCHQLIRQGAKLVETAADIVDELSGLLAGLQLEGLQQAHAGATARAPAACGIAGLEADADYAKLLEAMGWEPVDSDALVRRSGLTIGEVSSMLLLLELQGLVRSLSGGRYQRVPTRPGGSGDS